MRRLLLALLALFWAGEAGAGTGTDYSGVTSMTFQNGVAPTADYAGAADTYIRLGAAAADSGKNYGASDTLKVSGPAWTGYQSSISKTLLSFDVSALPDSALIVEAYMYLYQNIGNSGANTDTSTVYRIVNAWNAGTGVAAGTTGQATSADWNNRTGLAWGTAGALSRTVRRWSVTDSSVTPVFAGIDTTNGATTVSSGDVSSEYETPIIMRSGAAAGSKFGWVAIDIVKLVRRWNNGGVQNNGVLVEMHNVGNDKRFGFWSSNYAVKAYRPKLIVKYYDPTSGSSSSGGRRTIGNAPGGLH